MKKILYATGDSFTFGMEILGDNSQTTENKKFAYPAELSRLLNIESFRNEAYCGATNEFIFRKTIENLLEMEASGINPKDVFVVIGWTAICRAEINAVQMTENILQGKMSFEEFKKNSPFGEEFQNFETFFISANSIFVTNQKEKIQFNTAQPIIDFFTEYIWRNDLEYEKWFVQQESLKNLLNNKGYDFLMLNTTQKFELNNFNSWTKNLMTTLDSRYIDPTNFSMHDWVKEFYPHETMKFKHPAKKAHQKFAEYIHQYIINNNIIKDHLYV
jgi:hypothetical protein